MAGNASFTWASDLEEAQKMADEAGRLVLVDFFSPT